MSKQIWIIGDRLGCAWDEWKSVRGNFLLGLFLSAVALHLATIAAVIAWLELQ